MFISKLEIINVCQMTSSEYLQITYLAQFYPAPVFTSLVNNCEKRRRNNKYNYK